MGDRLYPERLNMDFNNTDENSKIQGAYENMFINELKVKAQCDHCGKKQKATEKDYTLDDVACKFCKKEGTLRELK